MKIILRSERRKRRRDTVRGFLIVMTLAGCIVWATGCNSDDESQPVPVSFDLTSAKGLVSLSPSTSTPPSGLAALTTREEVESNLRALLADGKLGRVIYAEKKDDGSTQQVVGSVVVHNIRVSPAGQVYFEFAAPGVMISGSACVIVQLTPPNQVRCFVKYGDFTSLTFDKDGNPYIDGYREGGYYSCPTGGSSAFELRRMSLNGDASTVLSREKQCDILLKVGYFRVAPDGSLIFFGSLEGDKTKFFRYFPSQGRLERLNTPDFENVISFDIVDNKLYVVQSSAKSFVIGTFANDGTLSFQKFSVPAAKASGQISSLSLDPGLEQSIRNSEFTRSSSEELYFVTMNYDARTGSLITASVSRLYPSPATIEPFGGVKPALTKLSGEYLTFTGTSSQGKDVFIRKKITDGSEVDLLGGRNLLVQRFESAPNGDIYFGAVDLNTTKPYLYKYNNAIGQLEQMSSLPGNLKQIVLLK